jgi:hypothetical protein
MPWQCDPANGSDDRIYEPTTGSPRGKSEIYRSIRIYHLLGGPVEPLVVKRGMEAMKDEQIHPCVDHFRCEQVVDGEAAGMNCAEYNNLINTCYTTTYDFVRLMQNGD